MTKSLLVSFVFLTCAACQTASLGAKPVSAGALTAEYQKSIASVRNRYDGKEIIVRGYTLNPPEMPQPAADQGLVLLEDNGSVSVSKVACWFSKEQATEFSKIKGNQYLTVRGVFNGERGVDLKFCKLVKID
jgi:hypothetical protein